MKPLKVIPVGAKVTFGRAHEPTEGAVSAIIISDGGYTQYHVVYYDRDGDRCLVTLEAFEADTDSDDRQRIEFGEKS